ncbi:MAG: SRPBCC family protein [Rhodoferax sp.]|nr:SRPBCC family protein [Rhodoferax sp.]
MAIKITLQLGYEFEVKAKSQAVFDLLSDVPQSASYFPKVDRLVDLEAGGYRWEMEKIGIGQFTLQTVYASRYTADRKQGRIAWTPIEGEGNASVSGNWQITSRNRSTQVRLSIEAVLRLPFPALTRPIVAPLVSAEFEKLVEQYIDNLVQQFGGEV